MFCSRVRLNNNASIIHALYLGPNTMCGEKEAWDTAYKLEVSNG